MRLKRLPRRNTPVGGAGRRPPRRGAAARPARRCGGRMARRPGPPIRARLAGRLPRLGRVLAVLAAAAVAAGLAALIGGPWLRVTSVAWGGERYTEPRAVGRILSQARGDSLLGLDTLALAAEIERLPAVAEARVEAQLPGGVNATIVEHAPAFVWHTRSARFLGSADGTLFASLPRDGELAVDVARLPAVHDGRQMARYIREGDELPRLMVGAALSLAELDPAALGSATTGFVIRVDDEHGFVLRSAEMGWSIALGVADHDPTLLPEDATVALNRKIAAVRTLFATQPEVEVGWVDARNPGKVYFRVKG